MKNFFLFCVIIAIIDLCWSQFMVEYPVPYLWFILLFFIAATIVYHSLTLNFAKGKPQVFIRFYMISTMVRMLLYVVVILVYRFIDKPTLIPFAIAFMVHYFLFTIFEVSALLKRLKVKTSADNS